VRLGREGRRDESAALSRWRARPPGRADGLSNGHPPGSAAIDASDAISSVTVIALILACRRAPIRGEKRWLWRAIDQNGVVLEFSFRATETFARR
jgi:hypothetical protein